MSRLKWFKHQTWDLFVCICYKIKTAFWWSCIFNETPRNEGGWEIHLRFSLNFSQLLTLCPKTIMLLKKTKKKKRAYYQNQEALARFGYQNAFIIKSHDADFSIIWIIILMGISIKQKRWKKVPTYPFQLYVHIFTNYMK